MHRDLRGVRVAMIGVSACAMVLALLGGLAAQTPGTAPPPAKTAACPGDNGGLSLSPGFCATVFADNLGHVRHLVVAPDGTVYVNTWSGRYFKCTPAARRFLSRPEGHQGRRPRRRRPALRRDAAIGRHRRHRHRTLQRRAVRRGERPHPALCPRPGRACRPRTPTVVVSGLPLTGDHPMHPFVIDAQGNLFVDLGSATNSCQSENRIAASPGIEPCTETRDARRHLALRRQQDRPGLLAGGALRHGPAQRRRPRLRRGRPPVRHPARPRPALPELAAPLHRRAGRGAAGRGARAAHGGRRLRLAGMLLRPVSEEARARAGIWRRRRQDGRPLRAAHRAPVAAFPGHWAPNDARDLSRHQVSGRPIAAAPSSPSTAPGIARPCPQGGYNVVFQPLADGKASGPLRRLRRRLRRPIQGAGRAAFRPSGLAVGPDGALYVGRRRAWPDLARHLQRQRRRQGRASGGNARANALRRRKPFRRPRACIPTPAARRRPADTAGRDAGAGGARRPHLPRRGRATAPAAAAMARTPAAARSGRRSTRHTGCGATAAWRVSATSSPRACPSPSATRA